MWFADTDITSGKSLVRNVLSRCELSGMLTDAITIVVESSGGSVGVHERFDWDGTPIDPGFRRVRVIARQTYVFAHAAIGGITGARDKARAAAGVLMSRAIGTDGQFVSRLTPQGDVLDGTADLYDIAFGLFAMAWWFRLSADERAIDIAEQSLNNVVETMQSGCSIGFVARRGEAGPLQQNPHMHLFEAVIFLAAFSGRPIFRTFAEQLFTLAKTRLIDRASGTLPELFDQGWRPLTTNGAIRIEPGHHYEWAWLLNRYGSLCGEHHAFDLADTLFDFARSHGHDAATGLIFDSVDTDGRVVDGDFRIWPNLEYLKALVSMRERHGDKPEWTLTRMADCWSNIERHFLTRRSDGPAAMLADGLWIDYLHGGTLQPRCDHVPASTLYHIMFAYSEQARHRAGHDAFSGRPW